MTDVRRARPAAAAAGTGVACRFDDLRAGTAREGRGLRAVLETRTAGEVPALLEEVDRAASAGLHAAGFVAYEAAPAFDSALRVHAGGSPCTPKAWFALFEELAPTPALPPPATRDGAGGTFEPEIDEAAYRQAVAAIHERIAAGYSYQVNYTTRLRAHGGAEPEQLYRRLAAGQRGAYHALLTTGDWAVACGSPELFFERRGERVVTRPMKGTAARGADPTGDRAAAAALRASEKERCENVMIVDLLRSDLGRVARTGSVRVEELFALEGYPTVWQLTSTVSCRVGAGTGLVDLFRALFPCGSVTGAPKPETMSIIAGLETSPRGPYCGAVGWVSGGAARFAVGIRTAVVDRNAGRAEFGVGSGITWYADAGAEWAELRTKASVLGGHQDATW